MAHLLPRVLVHVSVTLILLGGVISAEVVNLEEGSSTTGRPPMARNGDTGAFGVPESVTVLDDNNFDSIVWPSHQAPSTWILFVYAPWCSHCKQSIPLFLNASIYASQVTREPHSKFGVINAQQSKKLAARFKIQQYPTILYTTAKGTNWHVYHGGKSVSSFMSFSVQLHRAALTGCFADDVTSIAVFDSFDRLVGTQRVSFYVFVPKSSRSTPSTMRSDLWSAAVDGIASIGNTRFGVIYESLMPPTWREDSSTAYLTTVQAAYRCLGGSGTRGPAGEVLLGTSDVFSSPQCYTSEWLADGASGSAYSAMPSAKLVQFVHEHGLRAVEELNAGLLSMIGDSPVKGYLGIVVTDDDGRHPERNNNFVPMLRDMTQKHMQDRQLQPTSSPPFRWSYLHGNLHHQWRRSYNIATRDLPAVIVVDVARNRIFRLANYNPSFDRIKREVPWAIHGPQRKMLDAFVGDVLAGNIRAEKSGILGYVAEYLSHVYGLSTIYTILRYDDVLFVVVVCALVFFSSLVILGIAAEPILRCLERRQRAAAAAAASAVPTTVPMAKVKRE